MPELPEDCTAYVLSFTDPRQVCALSVISPEFNHAAQCDDLWNKFLPPDYQSLIAGSTSPSLLTDLPSKKQLYLSLCDRPILIDGERTSFSLEKPSGKKIYLISARSLSIIWGDASLHWEWKSDPKSRFRDTAQLSSVCWLEIRGRIRAARLSAATMYGVYLVYKLAERAEGFGRGDPLEVAVRGVVRKRSLHEGRRRGDGWLEIELGEYFRRGNRDFDLEVSVMEIKRLYWKSGLIVEGIEFRPKEING